MKKSKLKLALVTSFIASMALAACGSKVTKSDKDLVEGSAFLVMEILILLKI